MLDEALKRPRGIEDAVWDLVLNHKLHLFDAEWICKLPADKQMPAAAKCMGANATQYVSDRNDRSTIAPASSPRRGYK